MLTAKARYPWKIGATSFVIPADLAANVALLAPHVDAVQLLFFESAAASALENVVDIKLLAGLAAAHDLTYTVHLPDDLFLGDPAASRRLAGVAEITRLVEDLASLSPASYDLHLRLPAGQDQAAWLAGVEASLALLAERLGRTKELVAVENIDYPYGLIREVVAAHGFSRCLDFGHIKKYGHDLEEAGCALGSARHVHFHGVVNGRDHEVILPEGAADAALLGGMLCRAGFAGVVTLEVYALEKLETSLRTLTGVWKEFERSEV